MSEKSKKITNCIFTAFFMLALILPACFMNLKHDQVSEIDNKLLTEWPEFTAATIDSETISGIESYVDDRVGFRNAAIKFYTTACDKLFNVLVHPLYMYGQGGHAYYRADEYIAAYQRLNTDEQFIETFVDFLKRTDEYCKSKNIKFLYYLCTDKKTIYPEYFPASINVNEKNESVIQCMQGKLKDTDLDYIIPYDTLMEKKQSELIYNKKYDVAHWNELGSFAAHTLLDEKMQNWFDDVPPLTEDLFSLEYVKQEKLYQSELRIDEDVPVYTLVSDTSEDASEYLEPYLDMTTTDFYKHYVNPNVPNNHTLLIFTDSYFATYSKYYNNRFRNVYYIHRQNFQNLQYYVNLLFPDIIIFETAERCITSDMMLTDLYGSYENFYYEPPYITYVNQFLSSSTPPVQVIVSSGQSAAKPGQSAGPEPDLSYSVLSAKGVRVDGNTIFIDPEEGDNIVSIRGIMKNYDETKDLDIYFIIDGNCLEAEYSALKMSNPYAKEFEINVQRQYIGQTEINLICVDRTTNIQYDIETFEVKYGR